MGILRALSLMTLATAATAVAHAGTPICACTGDANGDGLVNAADVSIVLGSWGPCTQPCEPSCPADFDGDCIVGTSDLAILLGGWGPCVADFPDPGPSIPQAMSIGTIGPVVEQYCEFIGPNDVDVWKFTLSSASQVTVSITNRVDGIEAWLVADKNGNGVFDSGDTMQFTSSSGANDLSLIEDLAAGSYFVWLDPYSSDYTNYSLALSASPLPSLPADPASSMPAAHNLGTLGDAQIEVKDLIGGYDGGDVFRFTTTQARAITVSIVGRTEGAQIWLIADKNGNGISDSGDTMEYDGTSGAGDMSRFEDLAAGTYFIWVNTYSSDDGTRYTLRLNSTTLPALAQDPAGSLGASHNLGTLSDAMVEVTDLIGAYDGNDVYKFTVTQARAVTLSLTGRTEGGQLWLVADKDGNGIFDSNDDLAYNGTSGNGDFSIFEDLAPGSYFAWVSTYSSDDSSRYTLRLTSSALPSLPADPGGSLPTAHDVGVVGDAAVLRTDMIGGYDGNDVYRFTINQYRGVTVTLTGRTEGAQLWIVADKDGDGIFDTNEDMSYDGTSGSGDLSVSEDLSPGTYFAWVTTYSNDDSTRYTISILSGVLPATPASEPGEIFATAYNLDGVGVGDPAFEQQVVGAYDGREVYRFTATSTGSYAVTLTGRTEGSYMWLVRDLDNDGIFDSNEAITSNGTSGAGDFSLSAALTSGLTYFVVIDPYSTDDSTRYTLQVFRP
jgi:hypothetical protein